MECLPSLFIQIDESRLLMLNLQVKKYDNCSRSRWFQEQHQEDVLSLLGNIVYQYLTQYANRVKKHRKDKYVPKPKHITGSSVAVFYHFIRRTTHNICMMPQEIIDKKKMKKKPVYDKYHLMPHKLVARIYKIEDTCQDIGVMESVRSEVPDEHVSVSNYFNKEITVTISAQKKKSKLKNIVKRSQESNLVKQSSGAGFIADEKHEEEPMDIESDAEVSEFPSDHSIVSTERNCIKTNEYPPDKICDVNKESVEQICVNRLRRKFAHSKNGVSKIANSKCKMPHIEINKTKESMCSQQETNKTLETHKQGTKSKLVSVERNKKDVGVIDTEVLPTTIEKAYSVGSRDVISSSIQDVEESTITGTSVDKHLVSSDNNESCSDAVCTTGHEDFDESDSLSDSTMLPPCSSLKICSGSSAGETSLQNSFQPAYRNIKPKPSNKASYQELLSFMNSDTEENDSESSFKTLANADCKQSRLKLRRIKKTTTKEDVDVVTSRKRKKSNYFKFPQKKTRIDRDGCSHENVSLVANCSRVFKKKANIPSSSIPADSYSDASGTDQAEDFSVDNKCIVLSDVDSEDSSVDRQLYKQKLELSIQKIRDVVQLNEEEMTYLVNKNEGYLRKIFQGKIYSWRHEDYKTGGIRRIDLTYQVHHGSFSEEQQEVVMQSLMLMFCATHSKYLDYVLKVMCPEALIKIQMDVCKTTHEETERNMKEFQKQRLNESQIVQPEFH